MRLFVGRLCAWECVVCVMMMMMMMMMICVSIPPPPRAFHLLPADPKFSGFQPLPDEQQMDVAEVLFSRNSYFPEGATIGNKLMKDYLADVRMHYVDQAEWRETVRNGSLFFVGTILLDWIICSI